MFIILLNFQCQAIGLFCLVGFAHSYILESFGSSQLKNGKVFTFKSPESE